jgi:hypothetical protein
MFIFATDYYYCPMRISISFCFWCGFIGGLWYPPSSGNLLTIVKTTLPVVPSSNKESLAYWYKLIRAALLVVPTTYEITTTELGATPPDKFLIHSHLDNLLVRDLDLCCSQKYNVPSIEGMVLLLAIVLILSFINLSAKSWRVGFAISNWSAPRLYW